MSARGRGEGSITRRRAGRYEVRISVGVENGKRRQLSFYAKTRTEAVRLLTTVRAQHQAGVTRSDRLGETTEHFLNRWLTDHVARTKREGTFRCYEQAVRQDIVPVIGQVRLTALTREHVEAVQNHALGRGLNPNTVRLVRVVLGAALRRAVKWEIPGVRNVVALTDAPPAQTRTRLFLDPQQARVFLDAVKDNRLAAFYMVALYCGLRLGELQALRWQDVELDQRQLRVAHSYRYAQLGLGEPKTKTSARTVDLPACVVTALKSHRRQQMVEQAEAGEKGIPWLDALGGLVFTGQYGSPTCRAVLRRDFTRILREAGLPPLRIHDLRHSYATLELAAGVSPKIVQESLGHTKLATTMDLYAHVIPVARREAADALERLLG